MRNESDKPTSDLTASERGMNQIKNATIGVVTAIASSGITLALLGAIGGPRLAEAPEIASDAIRRGFSFSSPDQVATAVLALGMLAMVVIVGAVIVLALTMYARGAINIARRPAA